VKLVEHDAVFYGVYADIFLASQHGQEVALKRPRRYIGHDHYKVQQALIRETLVWEDLNHPNILPCWGIDSQTFPSNLCIVSPWMRRGTILQHIQDSVPPAAERDRLLLETAQGLAYLHRQNIAHGSISGANILIDQDLHARLAGFSLAGLADPENYDSELAGWTSESTAEDESDTDIANAEESILKTTAADVYAFACVCLEIYTVQRVVANNNHDDADSLQLFHGQPPIPSSGIGMQMSDDLWGLIQSCWNPNSSCRPTMDHVLDRMKEIGFNTL